MNCDWDDLRTIMALVRCGSLAGAGDELGVNYTTVARRVKRAETALGEVLFERMADGYQPTEAARVIARHGQQMETAEHAMMRDLQGRSRELAGPLTVTAPQLLIAHVLAPLIEDFAERHPRVDLRLRATNDLLDLSRREADVAIRVSRNPGDTLKGIRLTQQHSASFATRDWANRIAHDPNAPIDWIVYEAYDTLPNEVLATYPGSRVRYRLDDMVAMAGSAAAGLGIVRMPMFLGRAVPGLVQVPVLPPQPYADIWIVAHPDVWPSAKLTAFRDMLLVFMKAERARFVA